jgi:hypothetical protein
MRRVGRIGLRRWEKWQQDQDSILLANCPDTRVSNRLANRQRQPKSKNDKEFQYSGIEISNRSYIVCFEGPQNELSFLHIDAGDGPCVASALLANIADSYGEFAAIGGTLKVPENEKEEIQR